LDAIGDWRVFKSLFIGVTNKETHVIHPIIVHIGYGITATTSHPDYFNQGVGGRGRYLDELIVEHELSV
jgi:hypothetical protein